MKIRASVTVAAIVLLLSLGANMPRADGIISNWRQYATRRPEQTKVVPVPEMDSSGSVPGRVMEFRLSPDGRRGLLTSMDGLLLYLHIESGKVLQSIDAGEKAGQSIDLHPSGNLAVSGGSNGKMSLWNLSTGQEQRSIPFAGKYVRAVRFSCTGRLLAAGGDSGIIVLYNADTGEEIRRFAGHTSGIRFHCLEFTCDDRRLVSGSWDGSVRVWDVATGTQQGLFQAMQGRVLSVAISPDGKQVLSSYLGPAILWDMETQKEIGRFSVKGNPWFAGRSLHMDTTAFSPDGKQAVFGATFGSAIVWDLSAWRELAHNRLQLPPRDSTATHFVQYLPDSDTIVSLGDTGANRTWQLVFWDQSPKGPSEITGAEQGH